MTRRHHEVCCGMDSDDFDTDDYERVSELTSKLEKYAAKLGFNVFSEADAPADDESTRYGTR